MDEVARTRAAYEGDADSFVEKYLSESVAARYGGEFYEALSGERILDVGCGPGADAAAFEDDGYDVTGLDITRSLLRTADELVSDGSFVRGDMRRLPFRDGEFDGIWSCASFLHVPRADARATLGEFRRVLTDEGVVFLSVKRPGVERRDPDERYFERYRREEFEALLADAAFDPLTVETSERWVSVIAAPA
ncbi:class I SAM-dependent methyltransferase [Halobacteriales archaeon QS_1_67_19]|nr:MAG: class I SAM-dependent methyltransferase [Halobacteriales archaeon QS_1_67_19]